ncbi:MAG: antiviral reverse transcriptase Drt3a [Hyphomonadaceae bacterium]
MDLYDRTINERSISKLIRRHDVDEDEHLLDSTYRAKIISETIAKAKTGFSRLDFIVSNLNGKFLYQCRHWSDELLFRKLTRNLRQKTGVYQSDRFDIVRAITNFCEEGLPYRIYKADIKNFYETIDVDFLLTNLKVDFDTSPTTYKLFDTLFQCLKHQKIAGLPRGLALSASLSEYTLKEFDRQIPLFPDVFYYARYVDDMIVITNGKEDQNAFLSNIEALLPVGLKFNKRKTGAKSFLGSFVKKKQDKFVDSFRFLGFEFRVNEISGESNRRLRKVVVDISPAKINKAKTKLIIAARSFLSDKNFNLFERRLKLITANYTFYDRSRSAFRKAGFYYSYGLIDADISTSLKDIDVFLRRMLLSRSGKLYSVLSVALTPAQRKTLLKYSFRKNFIEKRHYSYSSSKLNEALECWKYV